MREKRFIFILFVVLAALIFAGCDQMMLTSDYNTDQSTDAQFNSRAVTIGDNDIQTAVLYAGRNLEAGLVSIEVEDDNLLVTYTANEGWELRKTQLWLGEDLADMPQTKKGRPKIGLFPYKEPQTELPETHQYVIPLADLGGEDFVCGKTFNVAARAVLRKARGKGRARNMAAWADGIRIMKRGIRATYFTFDFECVNDVVLDNADAFAWWGEGDMTTFTDYDIDDETWAWVIKIDDLTATPSVSTPIYADAVNYDLDAGVEVGMLYITYDGTQMNVEFDMYDDFIMYQTHLSASDGPPRSPAPGRWGYGEDLLDGATNYVYNIPAEDLPLYDAGSNVNVIYIAAQAGVSTVE